MVRVQAGHWLDLYHQEGRDLARWHISELNPWSRGRQDFSCRFVGASGRRNWARIRQLRADHGHYGPCVFRVHPERFGFPMLDLPVG